MKVLIVVIMNQVKRSSFFKNTCEKNNFFAAVIQQITILSLILFTHTFRKIVKADMSCAQICISLSLHGSNLAIRAQLIIIYHIKLCNPLPVEQVT